MESSAERLKQQTLTLIYEWDHSGAPGMMNVQRDLAPRLGRPESDVETDVARYAREGLVRLHTRPGMQDMVDVALTRDGKAWVEAHRGA